jgi:LysM domain
MAALLVSYVPRGEPVEVPEARPRLTLVTCPSSAPERPRQQWHKRFVPGLLTVAVLIGLWLGTGALAAMRPKPASGVRLAGASLVGGQRYVVRPGDTLWSIAVALDPSGDPRPVVDELEEQLHGSSLQPGETLVLP